MVIYKNGGELFAMLCKIWPARKFKPPFVHEMSALTIRSSQRPFTALHFYFLMALNI